MSNTTLRWGVVMVELTMSDDAGDEDTLLAQIADGDMRALEALYRRLHREVA